MPTPSSRPSSADINFIWNALAMTFVSLTLVVCLGYGLIALAPDILPNALRPPTHAAAPTAAPTLTATAPFPTLAPEWTNVFATESKQATPATATPSLTPSHTPASAPRSVATTAIPLEPSATSTPSLTLTTTPGPITATETLAAITATPLPSSTATLGVVFPATALPPTATSPSSYPGPANPTPSSGYP